MSTWQNPIWLLHPPSKDRVNVLRDIVGLIADRGFTAFQDEIRVHAAPEVESSQPNGSYNVDPDKNICRVVGGEVGEEQLGLLFLGLLEHLLGDLVYLDRALQGVGVGSLALVHSIFHTSKTGC